MADLDDLRRSLDKGLAGREFRRFEPLLPAVAAHLDEKEQVHLAVGGDWYGNRRCLIVATSRQLIAADDRRVDPIPYEQILTVDYTESWRTARIAIRARGVGADVSKVHLDTARELRTLLQNGRSYRRQA